MGTGAWTVCLFCLTNVLSPFTVQRIWECHKRFKALCFAGFNGVFECHFEFICPPGVKDKSGKKRSNRKEKERRATERPECSQAACATSTGRGTGKKSRFITFSGMKIFNCILNEPMHMVTFYKIAGYWHVGWTREISQKYMLLQINQCSIINVSALSVYTICATQLKKWAGGADSECRKASGVNRVSVQKRCRVLRRSHSCCD